MNNNFRSLKIGLDYHGVINNSPQYFKIFCKVALNRGHRIYILTGGPKHHIMRKLKDEKIGYTAIFAIIDYYQSKQQITCPQYGHFYIKKRLWNTAKAAFCYQHQINIQIDDSDIYGKYFITPYCKYEKAEKKCFLNLPSGKTEILLQSPCRVLKNIEDIYFESKTNFFPFPNRQHTDRNNDNPN